MARASFSTVFDRTAADIWAKVREFGDYALWVDHVDESTIEGDRPGDAVGAVRRARMGARVIRQRLLAHSDLERTYVYEFADAPPPPLASYRATIRVTKVTDGDRAFVEWWADFDVAPAEIDHWRGVYAAAFAGRREFLRRRLR